MNKFRVGGKVNTGIVILIVMFLGIAGAAFYEVNRRAKVVEVKQGNLVKIVRETEVYYDYVLDNTNSRRGSSSSNRRAKQKKKKVERTREVYKITVSEYNGTSSNATETVLVSKTDVHSTLLSRETPYVVFGENVKGELIDVDVYIPEGKQISDYYPPEPDETTPPPLT
jgi:uncharacterized protein YpmB